MLTPLLFHVFVIKIYDPAVRNTQNKFTPLRTFTLCSSSVQTGELQYVSLPHSNNAIWDMLSFPI